MADTDAFLTSPPAASGDVRTFLIADVRGYTSYTLQYGDEAAAHLAARFADVVEEIVGGRDGRVIELRGDEALAVFASARQALRAAVDLQNRFIQETERDSSVPLKVGIGVDAGEAVPVRDGFRGAALNMAARLCSLAGPGEVLASDGVVHLARKVDGIAYAERGMVQLKGFADPVRVIRIEPSMGSGERSMQQESQLGQETRIAPQGDLPFGGFLGALPVAPLVARTEELTLLLRAVDAVADGNGHLVLVSGEPGVGKTRLAQEVTLNVRNRGFAIAAGRCYEAHSTVPFYPFVEALTAAYAAAPAGLQSELPRRWPDLARLLPSLGAPVLDNSGSGDQQRLFWAVTSLLQCLAAIQPVAVMLDDLHWADTASLELLQHLARHMRKNPVLLLGTFRDVEVSRQHPLEAALRDLHREGLVERVDLRRLERAGTSQLIAASMGEEEISEEFAEIIYLRTEGNPFFVQQVMRVLVERGDVFRHAGRWDRKTIEEIEVPESIRSVVGQRLSRLSTATQEVLYEASILGQAFHFDDLQNMSARPESEIEAALTDGMKGGLVRETGRDIYSFDHALTQQSLYGEMTTRRRRRLHLAAGEAIEALPERRREGRVAELAWHFLEGDDPVRALHWSLTAGNAAMHVFAYSDAEMHYRTAREFARELEDSAHEAEALQGMGAALLSLSRFDEGIEALEASAALYWNLHDIQGELRVVAQIGWAHGERGTRHQGIDRLKPLLNRTPATPSPPVIELQVELARLYFLEGHYAEALPLTEEAVSAARRLGDDRLLARAQTRRASVLAFVSRFDEALEGYGEAISLAERTDDLNTLIVALNNLWVEQMRRHQTTEADATLHRQLQVVQHVGEPGSIAWVQFMIGITAMARGQFMQARTALEESAAISRTIGPNRSSSAIASAVTARLMMGDETALQDLEDVARSPDTQARIWALIDLSSWDLLHDRPLDALNRLRDLSDDSEIEHQSRWEIDCGIARALVRLGELERAETMAIAGLADAHTMGMDRAGSLWNRVLMAVRIAQGRVKEAQTLREQIVATQLTLGLTFEAARTEYEYGAALLAGGDGAGGRKALEEVLHTFRRLDSPPYVRRIEEVLARQPTE